ncbi:hypothetical protein KIN20_020935 [Parelaphostrongylus tenuis]|uniref:Uncharacterized protein n=1 Tax=Parelaphostrongylus tenuis TaxID=148309 RepID=A0AAD5N3R4_PARTN|nr:hypothetical protein KIN20_020935 [Parelaphostrongylus tenuis]
MVYTGDSAVSARIPGIATSREGAQGFVTRLVMQTVFDVLERQGRNALLPEAVISTILGQLSITITYEPMQCQKAVSNVAVDMVKMNEANCVIVGNTVTGVCINTMDNDQACTHMNARITPVPTNHTSISGTLVTTNIIMANWPRTMWQTVVNRALRMLASSSFGSHFFSATGTVGGN